MSVCLRLISGFFVDGFADDLHEFVERNGDLLLLAVDAVGDGTIFLFLLADDEGEWDLVDDGLTESIAKLIIRIVELNADFGGLKSLDDFLRVFAMGGDVDWKDGALDWS